MPPERVPPEGPSAHALEAFARAIERGLRDRYPGWDFIVRRRRPAPDESTSTPDDRQAVGDD